MFLWYYRWKARRREKASSYSLDRRRYRRRFGPGFFAFMEKDKMWGYRNSPYEKRIRKFRIVIIILLILAAIGIGWIAWESIHALQLF